MVNDKECEDFLTDLIAAYPTIESLAKSITGLGSYSRSWAKAWQDLTLADCLDVLDQLQRGLIDQPSYEDKESPGVWIRRLVQRLNGHKKRSRDCFDSRAIECEKTKAARIRGFWPFGGKSICGAQGRRVDRGILLNAQRHWA